MAHNASSHFISDESKTKQPDSVERIVDIACILKLNSNSIKISSSNRCSAKQRSVLCCVQLCLPSPHRRRWWLRVVRFLSIFDQSFNDWAVCRDNRTSHCDRYPCSCVKRHPMIATSWSESRSVKPCRKWISACKYLIDFHHMRSPHHRHEVGPFR